MQRYAFPVMAIGDRVYARSSHEPIVVCSSDQMAAEVAARLNYSDICGFMAEEEKVDDCPSCHGLNISCPEGCGRDPVTGELDGSTLHWGRSAEGELVDPDSDEAAVVVTAYIPKDGIDVVS